MKKHIPSTITCLNLFSGCLAAVSAFNNDIDLCAFFVFLAAIFDFFDGMLARLLKVSSNIGKDLDSLADMVSFGFVPGLVLHMLMKNIDWTNSSISSDIATILSFVPFIVTVFSGVRLAKFNNDTRQSDSFIGLPTPANTLLIISLTLIAVHNKYELGTIILNPWFIIVLSIVSAYLLVAELPLVALKFKTFGVKGNELRYILIGLSILLISLFSYAAIPGIILLYVALSLLNNSLLKT